MDLDYKTKRSTKHRAKFRGDRPTKLEDYARKKIEIWGKDQRESARRPKSDWKKIRSGDKIFSASNSRGSNSNALAYAERAMST